MRRSYSHFRRTHVPLVILAVSVTPGMVLSWSFHTPCVGSLFSRYPSRPAWSRRGPLTRLAWARCSRGIRHARHGLVAVLSHALCGFVVFAVSVTPGVVSSRSFHMSCVGSLFSRYLLRPAWSRHGPLTRLAWARCSHGICHARRGLVAVLSHALCGLVVLAVSVTPGVVSSRSSHTPCVGSLFVWGLVVAAPVSRVERGRSVERDNRLRGEESPD